MILCAGVHSRPERVETARARRDRRPKSRGDHHNSCVASLLDRGANQLRALETIAVVSSARHNADAAVRVLNGYLASGFSFQRLDVASIATDESRFPSVDRVLCKYEDDNIVGPMNAGIKMSCWWTDDFAWRAHLLLSIVLPPVEGFLSTTLGGKGTTSFWISTE